MSHSQQIIALSEKDPKVMGFNQATIFMSSKSHKSFDDLVAASEKSGFFESTKTISIADITSLKYNEANNNIHITHVTGGKEKKVSLPLADENIKAGLVKELAEMRGLKESITEESKLKPLLWNLLWLAITLFVTVISRNLALEAEQGEHYVATGRRSGLTQLFVNLVESLGPTIVTIIGLLVFTYFLYTAYSRYKTPAKEVIYQ